MLRHTCVAATLLLAACVNTDSAEVSDDAIVSATVAAVNPETRAIDLRTEDGGAIRLTATPAMRNFDQIEVGDVASLEIYGSIMVRVAGPDAPAEPQTLAVLGRAPEGARPGAVAGSVTTLTVEFVSYDPATREASLILPDGDAITVPVEPGMQAFAAARAPGEMIEVTLSDAVAMIIEAPAA
jgi:hypothetical protein